MKKHKSINTVRYADRDTLSVAVQSTQAPYVTLSTHSARLAQDHKYIVKVKTDKFFPFMVDPCTRSSNLYADLQAKY